MLSGILLQNKILTSVSNASLLIGTAMNNNVVMSVSVNTTTGSEF